MFQYDPITEQILRTERLLLKLRRDYETQFGDAEQVDPLPAVTEPPRAPRRQIDLFIPATP